MADLSTRYLGLSLRSPLVASAGPATGSLDKLAELDEAGVGAVVLPSLFAEQVDHDLALSGSGSWEYSAALGGAEHGADAYLDLVGSAKDALSCPVVASINGTDDGGWTRKAQAFEDAGADAVELNVYFIAADFTPPSEVERRYLDIVEAVRHRTSLPLAVKIAPSFTSIPVMARRLVDAGADGLVLFNRFIEPDIDLDALRAVPDLQLSVPAEQRGPLRWIALLHHRVRASLALSTGVHDGEAVARALLAGADVAMSTSALLRHGPRHARTMIEQLEAWMRDAGFDRVKQLKGRASLDATGDPVALERANYVDVLSSYRPAD